MYAREFLDLQIDFAERAAALLGVPLAQALLDFTNLYVRFGLGRGFDPEHPDWRAFAAGGGDLRARAWDRYRAHAERATAPATRAVFGCFSVAVTDHVRLHFRNADPSGASPLSPARRPHRRAELRALFAEVRIAVPEHFPVRGISWLYNVAAYRGLFPAAFTRDLGVAREKFRSMTLWGQFVDHRGAVKDGPRRRQRDAVAACRGANDLDACFPLSVRTARAPLAAFLAHYGV